MFGHESGAFTGASGARAGCFEAAQGGTLFLDEIGDLSLPLQVKLLCVLQECQVVRLGSRRPVALDVRLVAATNVDLQQAVQAGRLCADLYWRLSVVTVGLLPARPSTHRPGPTPRRRSRPWRQLAGHNPSPPRPMTTATPSTTESTQFVPHRPDITRAPRSVADLQQRAAALLPLIAEGAAARERDRVMPYAWVRRFAEAGLYTLRIPQALGGAGGRLRDLARLVIDVAAVDSNLAQALRPGFGFIESVLASPDDAARTRWLPLALDGQVFGNAGWERGGPNGQITARLTRDGDHYRISGTKFYSTGALYADWISAFALDDDGREVGFIVPRGRPGLRLVDDFDAMGQRLTASGTTVFDQVLVRADELRAPMVRDKRSPLPPLYQLFLAAVLAGIARNVLTDAVHFARHHARPIKHSTAQRSVDDPYVQETVGAIAAQAFAADAAVLRAAESIDAAWDAGLTQDALTAASVDVAQAQFFTVQAALKAAETLFDVGGATTTLRDHNLDRHWRNARTVANHNPRQWKAAAVGAWLLSGTQPPTTGLF